MIDDEQRPEDTSFAPESPEGTTKAPIDGTKPKAEQRPKRIKKQNKGVGFGTVCVMSVFAAILGAAGGGVISHLDLPFLERFQSPALERDVQKTRQTMSDLEARLASLENQPATISSDLVKDLEARLATLESRAVVTEAGETVDQNVLERLEALEAASPFVPTDLSDIKARLDALDVRTASPADSRATGLDPAILDRLSALENQEPAVVEPDPEVLNRLTALEKQDLPDIPEPVDLTPVFERLGVLEKQTASLRADFNAAMAARQSMPLPPFPREEVVAAISTVSEEKKGWFERTINKHVQIRDESLILIVDDIEALLLQGEVHRALKRIEDLPREGRDAAQPWVDEVKIQRTSL